MSDDHFEGWTLEELAHGVSGLSVSHQLASDLARDLIAAKARVRELDGLQRETVAQGRAEILGLRAKLAAAEATIARVRELSQRWLVEAWSPQAHHSRALEAALGDAHE